MKYRANILLADDRPDQQVVYRAILDDLGQNFVAATSGEEALKQVLKQDFAVILLDVDMRGMDGLETAILIRGRQQSANVPIIFITARLWSEERTAQAYALGAVDFMDSPVVPEILRSKVKVFVDLYLFAKHARRQVRQRIALVAARDACSDAERSNRRYAYLAGASVALSRSLNVGATVRELVRLVIPFLADVAAATLPDGKGGVPRTEMAWSGHDAPGPHIESLASVECARWREAIDRVMASGVGESYTARGAPVPEQGIGSAELQDDLALPRGPKISSLAILPLIARGHPIGVLSLGLGPTGRKLSSELLAIASDLADRAAIALDNARLYHEARSQRSNCLDSRSAL